MLKKWKILITKIKLIRKNRKFQSLEFLIRMSMTVNSNKHLMSKVILLVLLKIYVKFYYFKKIRSICIERRRLEVIRSWFWRTIRRKSWRCSRRKRWRKKRIIKRRRNVRWRSKKLTVLRNVVFVRSCSYFYLKKLKRILV